MKHFISFAFIGALLINLPLQGQGQNHTACGTPSPKYAPIFGEHRAENLNANPYVVQIFVHILRNDDGSNAAMSDAALKTNLDRMASFYRPHNICFTFVGRDFIDNTTWNTNYTIGLIGALHAVNPHTDAIDIYVHKNGFDGFGGYAYDIPSPKYSVAAGASFNFEHEMGHCLGLLHTFETANGTECPDGSNCGTAGDLVCGTPADFSGSQNSNNGACGYNGNQTINCNANTFGYNPSTTNIMSYWAGCYNDFTADQATRMSNTINSTAFLQARLTPDDRIIAGVTLTGEIAVGAQNSIRIGNIAALGDVAMNGNAHGIFNAGSYIQVVPGTSITPTGTNSILLTINTLCDGLLFATSNFQNEDRHTRAQTAPASDKIEVFPNPFSDAFTIRFEVGERAPVSLQVFDALGKLVHQWYSQEMFDPGQYSVQSDGLHLAPGIYYVEFAAPSGRKTQKLVKVGQ